MNSVDVLVGKVVYVELCEVVYDKNRELFTLEQGE